MTDQGIVRVEAPNTVLFLGSAAKNKYDIAAKRTLKRTNSNGIVDFGRADWSVFCVILIASRFVNFGRVLVVCALFGRALFDPSNGDFFSWLNLVTRGLFRTFVIVAFCLLRESMG